MLYKTVTVLLMVIAASNANQLEIVLDGLAFTDWGSWGGMRLYTDFLFLKGRFYYFNLTLPNLFLSVSIGSV